jgi:hypothetical protein
MGMGRYAVNVSGGLIKAYGKFIGGPYGITESQRPVGADTLQTQLGINGFVYFDSYYLALSVDRFSTTTTALKLGYTF